MAFWRVPESIETLFSYPTFQRTNERRASKTCPPTITVWLPKWTVGLSEPLDFTARSHVGPTSPTSVMGVHDDFQGRGVGTALMKAALDLADNWLNLKRVELTVFADNARAVYLYEKFGFAVEGTHRAHAFRNGEYVDSYSMARIKE